MKKLLVFMLAFLFLFAGCAFAEETPEVFQSGDYKYILLENGTAEITKYFGEDEVLTIPDVLEGYAVTSIGNEAFHSCYSLTTVTIPDSVSEMGGESFCGMFQSQGHPCFAGSCRFCFD